MHKLPITLRVYLKYLGWTQGDLGQITSTLSSDYACLLACDVSEDDTRSCDAEEPAEVMRVLEVTCLVETPEGPVELKV